EDDLVPAGTDLLGGHVDGGEAGSTEAVDLDAGDGVRHPCGEGGDAREIHPLVAERGDDPVDDVRDPVLVEIGETLAHLPDQADGQIDRLDAVEGPAGLAFASRGPDGVVDECLGHGWVQGLSLDGAGTWSAHVTWSSPTASDYGPFLCRSRLRSVASRRLGCRSRRSPAPGRRRRGPPGAQGPSRGEHDEKARIRWGSGLLLKLCSAVTYSPTPSRVQYHRRWQA